MSNATTPKGGWWLVSARAATAAALEIWGVRQGAAEAIDHGADPAVIWCNALIILHNFHWVPNSDTIPGAKGQQHQTIMAGAHDFGHYRAFCAGHHAALPDAHSALQTGQPSFRRRKAFRKVFIWC